MSNDLSRLILLQKLDVEIRQLQDEVTSLPLRQQELEQQFAAAVTEYLALKNGLETAQTEKRELEEKIDEEQQRHLKFKNDLMKSTNEREYTTAVREIDVARKVISQHETEILKLMEQIEKLEQLRVLENGFPIAIDVTEDPSIGVDTPEDAVKFEQALDAS